MSDVSLDRCLYLVADWHRRQIIQRLRHKIGRETTIDDLVDHLYDDSSVVEDESTDRKQLTLQLYHTHLPKLAEYGVIEYDRDDGSVRYQPDDQIETVLDSLSATAPLV